MCNCITSPRSCHPHLGTCTVTLVFLAPLQKTVPPSYAASCWLHPWAFGVEALGNQPDHLGEEMVIVWCQFRTVSRVAENLPVEELVRGAVWGRALSCRRTTPLVSIPRCFFGSTSEAYSALNNKPVTLLWSLVPKILSTKFPYGPRMRTSQLAGAAMIVSMFHR